MSHRKKHAASKQERNRQESIFHTEFQSSEEVRPLPTSRLTSGLPYQRPVRDRDVDALIQTWDDRLMDPLTVSFRDGKFYLVDGQHRVAAMRKMHDGSEVILPCKIFTGLTYEQEAALCAKLDKSRKPMTLSETAKALMESGENTEMMEIKRRLEQEGFVWVLRKKIPRDYEIVVTRTVLNAYHLLGSVSFSRMFALIRDAWRGNPASLTSYIISGIPYVIALYIRLSVEDSKTGSLNIENQRHMLHQYAASMEGLKNVEVLDFIDNGYSGTNFERPAVQKLLDMVREGKINCIIVKDFTRFGRNSLEVGYFLERVFPLFHIRFISIGDGFDSNDYRGNTGGISIAIQFLAGELYSRDLSMKYKSANFVISLSRLQKQ